MKKFITSNHWWITGAVLLASTITQLLIYKSAYSSAYPWGIFYTILVVLTAIPLIAKNKLSSILAIVLSLVLSLFAFLNKPMYTINNAKDILENDNLVVSRTMVMDGVDFNGKIKIYLFLTEDDKSVYFNPYSGEYHIGTAEKFISE